MCACVAFSVVFGFDFAYCYPALCGALVGVLSVAVAHKTVVDDKYEINPQ